MSQRQMLHAMSVFFAIPLLLWSLLYGVYLLCALVLALVADAPFLVGVGKLGLWYIGAQLGVCLLAAFCGVALLSPNNVLLRLALDQDDTAED